MKERCVNVLVLKIEWETAKITAALMNHPKKAGGTKVTVLKTEGYDEYCIPGITN